jgi:hypothetical protein
MQQEDLAPYVYRMPRPIPALDGVVAVGWIGRAGFPTSATPNQELLARIAILIARDQTKRVRSLSPCAVCGEEGITMTCAERRLVLGTAELWLPAVNDAARIYAAPDLI